MNSAPGVMRESSGIDTSETKAAESLHPALVGAGASVAVGATVGTATVASGPVASVNTAPTPLTVTLYVPAGSPFTESGMVVSNGVTTCAQATPAGLLDMSVTWNVLLAYCTCGAWSVAQASLKFPRTTAVICAGCPLRSWMLTLCTCTARSVG